MTCPFCSDREVLDRIIDENELVKAFPTYIPITPGHTLVAPVRCVAKVEDLTAEEFVAMMEMVKKIKKSLVKVFGAEGFNFAWNDGELAGQTVNHLHIHIVPRTHGDAGITEFEPRKFLYWPGPRNKTPQENLLEIAELIKQQL